MIKSITGVALVATVGLAGPLAAQQGGHAPSPAAGQAPAMMAHMHAHMHTMDSLGVRVDSALARMNRSTGDTKVNAMAEVLNALVAERKAMHAHMREMQSHEGGMMDRGQPDARKPHEHQTSGVARPDSAAPR